MHLHRHTQHQTHGYIVKCRACSTRVIAAVNQALLYMEGMREMREMLWVFAYVADSSAV